jgi:bifunctional N-acetylglucosamine-1-phosphate-uridyltransferase/glucosamine-1-phosphate-acetyltransferase GlmU-like protein
MIPQARSIVDVQMMSHLPLPPSNLHFSGDLPIISRGRNESLDEMGPCNESEMGLSGAVIEHNLPYQMLVNTNKKLFAVAANKNVNERADKVKILQSELNAFSNDLLQHVGHLVDGNQYDLTFRV